MQCGHGKGTVAISESPGRVCGSVQCLDLSTQPALPTSLLPLPSEGSSWGAGQGHPPQHLPLPSCPCAQLCPSSLAGRTGRQADSLMFKAMQPTASGRAHDSKVPRTRTRHAECGHHTLFVVTSPPRSR